MPARRPAKVTEACSELVESMGELDELGRVRAEIVLALADRLDAAGRSEQGVALQAVPGIAKQLHDAIEALDEQSGETEDFLAGIFKSA